MKDFYELATSRYSCRSYLDKQPEQEKIDYILQCAKVAPTARNFQPQKIFVVKSQDNLEKLAAVCPCTYNAPVVFVIACDNSLAAAHLGDSGNFGETDCAIICTHMTLAAKEVGLDSCIVGWFVDKEVKAALNIPQNYTVYDILPVGYAGDDAAPSPRHSDCKYLSETVQEI